MIESANRKDPLVEHVNPR